MQTKVNAGNQQAPSDSDLEEISGMVYKRKS